MFSIVSAYQKILKGLIHFFIKEAKRIKLELIGNKSITRKVIAYAMTLSLEIAWRFGGMEGGQRLLV